MKVTIAHIQEPPFGWAEADGTARCLASCRHGIPDFSYSGAVAHVPSLIDGAHTPPKNIVRKLQFTPLSAGARNGRRQGRAAADSARSR